MKKLAFLFFALLTLFSCNIETISTKDYSKLPAINENGTINMVVEIPAGTNHKYEYNYTTKKFEVEIKNGKERVVDFLPYPGNYGFIPNTLMDKAQGGDGDALDILLLSESLSTGTVVEVIPLATLLLEDDGEIDTKIIAIPLDSTKTIIGAKSYQVFLIQYDAARRIIEEWFTHYKGARIVKLIGWRDESYAWQEVEKWEKK